jgi:two-component system, OmpR family, sensor kinase
VELVVRDSGPGVAREDRERIFERFERAGSSLPGIGLGLYIVRRIVDAHHGSVRVESASGSGAAFIVSLPRRPTGRSRRSCLFEGSAAVRVDRS